MYCVHLPWKLGNCVNTSICWHYKQWHISVFSRIRSTCVQMGNSDCRRCLHVHSCTAMLTVLKQNVISCRRGATVCDWSHCTENYLTSCVLYIFWWKLTTSCFWDSGVASWVAPALLGGAEVLVKYSNLGLTQATQTTVWSNSLRFAEVVQYILD